MANPGGLHRPNLLFNLIGLLLIVGGLGVAFYGLADAYQVMQGHNPFRGDGPPVEVADGMTLAFWGVIVFTIGRYFWRGARRRGARDRFGRLLIISGYVLVGAGLDGCMHTAVGLWTASNDEAQSVVVRSVIIFCVWGIPGAVLAAIGFKLANEKALAQAGVNAGF
jgi:hypothetical protein